MEVINAEVPSRKAIIYGHSMGGYLALGFALDHPEMTEAVIMGGAQTNYEGKNSTMLGLMGFAYKHLLSEKYVAAIITAKWVMMSQIHLAVSEDGC